MNYEMRRQLQQLSADDCEKALETCTDGVLAVCGKEGYPYAVPLNYVRMDGKLYFHCAIEGHKLDAIRQDGKASFCVVEKNQVVPAAFSTDYRSVIVFGQAHIVEEESLRRRALEAFVHKFSAAFPKEGERQIQNAWGRVCIIELIAECITGKCASKKTQDAAAAAGQGGLL